MQRLLEGKTYSDLSVESPALIWGPALITGNTVFYEHGTGGRDYNEKKEIDGPSPVISYQSQVVQINKFLSDDIF